MGRNYGAEYQSLMKETIWGMKLRAFFFGYGSDITDNYLKNQMTKRSKLEAEASECKKDIPLSKENMDLEFRVYKIKNQIICKSFFVGNSSKNK